MAVDEYFAMHNEMAAGLKPSKIVEIPDVLEIIEICRDIGLPRVGGDYEHQPYIWMLEYRLVNKKLKMRDANLAMQATAQVQAQQQRS